MPARRQSKSITVEQQAEVDRTFRDLRRALEQGDGDTAAALFERIRTYEGSRRRAAEKACAALLDGAPVELGMPLLSILGLLAQPDHPRAYERIAKRRQVDDVLRIDARRLAGWDRPTAPAARLQFLDTLQDAAGALVRIAQGIARPGIYALDLDVELLEYLAAMPAAGRRAIVARFEEEAGPRALGLLHALLHDRDPETQLLALDVVERHGSRLSAAPVTRLARTTLDGEVRHAAGRALGTLLAREVFDPGFTEPQLPPLVGAWLSVIDGEGGQIALLAREVEVEQYALVEVLLDERSGIRDVIAMATARPELLQESLDTFDILDQPFIEVPLAALRGALAIGQELNELLGSPLPPEFELWEPLFHEDWPPPPDEEVIRPLLDDSAYAGRDDLILGSADALDHDWLASWSFDPTAVSRATDFSGLDPLLDGPIDDIGPVLVQLMDPRATHLLQLRLRRQAWLLEQDGDEQVRDLLLAVSASLRGAGAVELMSHPFLHGMYVEPEYDDSFGDEFSELYDPDLDAEMAAEFEQINQRLATVAGDPAALGKALMELLGPLPPDDDSPPSKRKRR